MGLYTGVAECGGSCPLPQGRVACTVVPAPVSGPLSPRLSPAQWCMAGTGLVYLASRCHITPTNLENLGSSLCGLGGLSKNLFASPSFWHFSLLAHIVLICSLPSWNALVKWEALWGKQALGKSGKIKWQGGGEVRGGKVGGLPASSFKVGWEMICHHLLPILCGHIADSTGLAYVFVMCGLLHLLSPSLSPPSIHACLSSLSMAVCSGGLPYHWTFTGTTTCHAHLLSNSTRQMSFFSPSDQFTFLFPLALWTHKTSFQDTTSSHHPSPHPQPPLLTTTWLNT